MKSKSAITVGGVILVAAAMLNLSADLLEESLFGDARRWQTVSWFLAALGIGLILVGVSRSLKDGIPEAEDEPHKGETGYLERLGCRLVSASKSGRGLFYWITGVSCVVADFTRDPIAIGNSCTLGWLLSFLVVIIPAGIVGAAYERPATGIRIVAWAWAIASIVMWLFLVLASQSQHRVSSFYLLPPGVALLIVFARVATCSAAAICAFDLIERNEHT